MKWIIASLVLIATATVSGEQSRWIGKWEVLPAADDSFSKWMTCAGFNDQVRDMAVKQKAQFEIAKSSSDGEYSITLSNSDSGLQIVEKFRPGKNDFNKTYFGMLKVTVNWESNEKGTVELDVEGKKSAISFDPEIGFVMKCGEITATRPIKKI